MRLTLRTLLAYLDDILERSDAEELAGKIRESDFASGLVHRIRGATGRMRLSSPPIIGKGMGNDANTVAEYLDNTLPTDRIPDYERVCLESDMHLAETASCHEILTLVLGEPAQIEDGLRERIHRMGHRSAPAKEVQHRFDSAQATSSDSSAAVDRETSAWRNENPADVPDYVAADRRSSVVPWLVAGLMGFLATAAILMAMGILPGKSAPEEVAANSGELSLPPAVDPQRPNPDPGASSNPVVEQAQPMLPNSMPVERSTRDTDWNEEPSDGAPPDLAELPPEDFVEDPTAELPGSPAISLDPSRVPAQATGPPATGHLNPPADSDSDSDRPLAVENSANPAELVGTDTDADPISFDSEDANSAAERAAAPGMAEDRDLGKLISDEQVLAVWDEVDQSWFRVATRTPLDEGRRYRVPSIFRPQLMLSKGIQLTLNSRCELRFLPPTRDGALAIRFDFGQAVVTNFSGNVEKITFQFGDQQLTITFGDGQSEFAMEILSGRLPGSDPKAPRGRHNIRIWATSGSIGIQDGDQPVRALAAGQLWSSTPSPATTVTEAVEMPTWIEAARRRPVDRDALDRLEPVMVTDRPLTLVLSEKVEGKQTSVSSLAARCLASLDHFEPLLSSFGDTRHQSAWREHFNEVQAAFMRGPEASQALQQAMKHVWGRNSEELFRLSAGFTPEQLKNGAAAELVESLSSEDLATRVVAFETLQRITGASHLYFAHRTPARRQAAVTAWQRQLRSGKIDYKYWPPQAGP